ncbi:DUF6923 family protein [Bacillus cereus group sp. BfR-BA-01331]|uniref:DUF7507 domain-containing protein n=1 Tax=Bacillus cereus group sp. BfR-BA-01331 TaxID=2920307 RepID=UPI001F58EEF1|nr:SdrD B-like domain-containing protein [Bacillus cereus group sp. BfR-BA-01331]
MAATISGIVFNDLNHNGQFDPGEPGIPNVFVVLFSSTAATCITTQTDINGNYSFTVTAAGTYTVYEPVANPGDTCPPTNFTQPDGFTMSNGPRKLTITVTAAQINNGATIANQNFSHDTVNNPLDCTTTMIQFAGTPSIWYNINVVTGATLIQGTVNPPVNINAIAYNTLDNYIYGYDQLNNNIVRVDNNGNVTALFPLPTGLPVDNYNVGAFDLNGFLYISVNDIARFYVIDLRPNSATFMKLVNPATGYTEQTSNFGVGLSTTLNVSDWVYNPSDNFLYGITPTGIAIRVSPTTGQITNLTTTPHNTGPFGAIALDSNGIIYAIANPTGNIYRYIIAGNTATAALFSSTVTTSFNDATMCLLAEINVDFGDAPNTAPGNGPDNYSTLLANNGPRHGIVNELVLGTKVTAETDAYQNPTATGDDISKGIQDDGLTVPLATLSVSATSYSLNVTVTNETGSDANLYGWIDFNEDGIFQGNEGAIVQVVPSVAGTQTVILNFTVPPGVTLTPGHTFVRLRLTTDNLINQNAGTPTSVDTRSVGPASDGEVEDYILQVNNVADLMVVKTNSPVPVQPGQELTYTIQVTNNGPDAAQDVTLTDDIPSEILNPEYSLDGGITFQSWTGSLSLGTLPTGSSVQIIIRGTVSPSATGIIANTATVSSTTFDPDLSNNTDTSFAPISFSADISVVKTASPTPVVAGELLTYTIVVSNAGPNAAQNVTLTDVIPSEILSPEYSIDGGVTFNPWPGTLSLGTLANGATETVLIRGTVSTSATDSITNTATVDSTTPDPDPTNNTSTVITPVNASADVAIIKTANPNPVSGGNVLTYTLFISNLGPSDAQNVIVTDAVPSVVLNPEYSTDGGVTFNPWPGTLSLGTLVNGATETILIQGTVSISATGTITNTATVESTTPDPDPTNNTSTVVTTVSESADISVVKLGNPNPVIAGQVITYTIVVSNAGPSDAENVTLTDAIPSVVLNPEFSIDGGVTFNPWPGSINLGTLVNGTAETVLIRGTVSANVTGSIINTATVESTTPDPDLTNNTSTFETPVEALADISVVKTGSPNPVLAGNVLTYTIVVSNAGPSDAENVMLIDKVPNKILNPEYSTDGGVTFNPWPGSINLGTLANGASQTIILRGTVNPSATGLITNTAVVNSTTPDPDPTNNISTEFSAINTSADISVVKTANPSPVLAGGILTYTVVVSNAGPNDALNVTVMDAIPSELLNPEYSTDGGITFNPWPGSINIGTLANGASQTIILRGTVNPLATGLITNTVTVDSTTPDPDPDNNTSTIVTPVNTEADISVTKLANPSPAIAGELLAYSVVVSNAGPNDALNVTLTDAIPSVVLNPEYSIDGGVTFNPWPGSINIGTLANGASITFLIRGTVSASATETIRNTATVDSTTPDPDQTNNTTTIDTPVNALADISVVKTGNPNPVNAGEILTYTLVVSNLGPSDAEAVTVIDAVSRKISNPEFSTDGGVTFSPWPGTTNIGTLPNGSSVTILIRGTVKSSVTGFIRNTAVVSSPTPDPNLANNRSTIVTPVTESADISVVKIGRPNPVNAGEILTYRLVVANAGPSDAQNVTLTDTVPSEILNPEYSVDGGNTFNPWLGSIVLGTLASGSSVTVFIRGMVSSSARGIIRNTATVSSTTPDPDPTNNTSTTMTLVTTSADISVVKVASTVPVSVGQVLTYTILVSNAGPSDAAAVTVTDAVPRELSNVEFSVDGGITFNPWLGTTNIGDLPKGETSIILIRGILTSAANGFITNTVTVSSTTPDPNPDNNTSTVVTPVGESADVSIIKTVNANTIPPGGFLTYTLFVSNAGPSSAQNVVVTDTIPTQLNNAEFSVDGGITFSPWTGTLNLGTLASGAFVTIIIRGFVSPNAIGFIINTATVSSDTPDPNPSNNTSTVITPIVPEVIPVRPCFPRHDCMKHEHRKCK